MTSTSETTVFAIVRKADGLIVDRWFGKDYAERWRKIKYEGWRRFFRRPRYLIVEAEYTTVYDLMANKSPLTGWEGVPDDFNI